MSVYRKRPKPEPDDLPVGFTDEDIGRVGLAFAEVVLRERREEAIGLIAANLGPLVSFAGLPYSAKAIRTTATYLHGAIGAEFSMIDHLGKVLDAYAAIAWLMEEGLGP